MNCRCDPANGVAASCSFIVFIIACVGLALPLLFAANYDLPTAVADAEYCTYQTKPGQISKTTSVAQCDSNTIRALGLFGACSRTRAMVKNSCKGCSSANTPCKTAWNSATTGPNQGLKPGCAYATATSQNTQSCTAKQKSGDPPVASNCCSSWSEFADNTEKSKKTLDAMSAGPVKDAAQKVYDAAKEAIGVVRTAAGLNITSIVLHFLGFIAILVGFCVAPALLGSAVLHLLAGLFYMVTGAYCAAKFPGSTDTAEIAKQNAYLMRSYATSEDGKPKIEAASWNLTFAAMWTAWLMCWICAVLAGLSYAQSKKVAGSQAGSV